MGKRAITLFVLAAAAVYGQNRGGEMTAVPLVVPLDQLPEFDVADIQPSKDGGGPSANFMPGGKLRFTALPLKFAILAAYGFETDESRVTGGPSWMNSEQFNIVAKAPPDSGINTLRLMLRSLLIKRFGLEAHIEDRTIPVYALTKGKGEPKLNPAAGSGLADCPRSGEDGKIAASCKNMTMDEFAAGLRGMAPAYFDKPVVNLTGIAGKFDFKLSWTPRGALLGTKGPSADSAAPADSEPAAGGLTIFESVDKQLGMRLESTRHPMPIIVVDKVNRMPTDK